MCRRLLFFLSSKRKRMSFSLKKNFFLFFCHTRLGFSKETKRLLFFCPPLFLSKIKIASKVWNVQNFGERETRALCRHGSARERGTKGTSLSLSLSLSLFLSRTKKTKRAVFERDFTREVAKFSKVFLLSSNDFIESFLSFPQTTRSKTHLCSSSLSLSVRITQGTPPQRRPEFGRLDGTCTRFVSSCE